jgi:protein TonB
MGRLVSCVVASLLLHGVVWAWLAARFSIFKQTVGQEAPEPIEADVVTDLRAPAGGGGGGTPAAPKRARVARSASRSATAEIAAPNAAEAAFDSTRPSSAGSSPAPVAGLSGPASGAPSGTGSGVGAGPGSGTGGGSGMGSGHGSSPDVAAQIQARILAHRRYPLLARKRGLEGTVEVVFRVDAAGNVVDLRVDKSAGELFDAAAVDAVRAAAPLPVCAQPIRVPIRFRLVEERGIR